MSDEFPGNGAGRWIRWAITITLGGVLGTLGFAFREAADLAALRQRVEDNQAQAARDRIEMRDDLHQGFQRVNEQMIMLANEVLNREPRRDREPSLPVFQRGKQFDK